MTQGSATFGWHAVCNTGGCAGGASAYNVPLGGRESEPMSYIAPSQFLRSKNIKVTAGMILDPAELGMEDHPVFGPLPTVEVLEAKEDGSVFLLAEFTCECGEVRQIHPGDWFQVRACETCTKKRQRRAKKVVKSDEVKAAEALTRETKRAEQAAKSAQAKLEAAQAKATKLAEEVAAKKALIAKVEAEKAAVAQQS